MQAHFANEHVYGNSAKLLRLHGAFYVEISTKNST